LLRAFFVFYGPSRLFNTTVPRPRAIGSLLVLIVLLAFLPAIRNGFVNYDDDAYVTQNPVVQRGITAAGIRWAFTGWHASNWHPLTWLSHMADTNVFRLNPAGHHLINVLFHAANCFLLFLLMSRFAVSWWPGLFVAALFALHPLHVESVAWISERKDVLSTFFAMLALLAYTGSRFKVQGSKSDGKAVFPNSQLSTINYFLALFFFACGLMCKPMLVTLPFVMLLLDYWPLERFKVQGSRFKVREGGKLVAEKAPFFLLTAAFCVITFFAQKENAVASLADVPLLLRFENAVVACAGYLFKTVWPAHLCVFYPLPRTIPASAAALAVMMLVLISVLVWRSRTSRPYLLVGWLWYLGTLVPVIGLVQVGAQAMADRYTYFPLIGIFIAISFLADDLVRRFPAWRIPMLSAGVAVLAACLFCTERQLGYWRDSQTLFSHALDVGGENTLARLNLGSALEEKNDFNGALEQYRHALELDPKQHEVYNNIGKLLAAQGRWTEAAPYCEKAVQLAPASPVAHYGLGVVRKQQGDLEAATREFSEAVRLDPDYAAPHFQWGQVLLRQGRGAGALSQLNEALRIQPDNFQMVLYASRVLSSDEDAAVRDGKRAMALAERAARLEANAAALDALGMACAENGRFEEALRYGQQAADLAGTTPEAADEVRRHMESYRQHHPWRESF
jgi:protein O-mannosyl-transferase